MATEFKNVVLIGAGGNLGPYILKAFLESPFNVTVLSRKDSKSTFPDGVKVIHADYDSQESLAAAFNGQDVVISLVGGQALGDQKKLVDAAIAAGVKRFLPSEFGSNTVDDRTRQIVPVFNAKKGIADYLKSKEDVIEWTSIVTGPFFDWGVKIGFLGFHFPSKTATLIDNGSVPFTSTNLYTIGKSVVSALEHPAETKNQYVYVSSFTTTQNDVLAELEKITSEKWNVQHITGKELIDGGRAKLQKGDFSGIADLIRAVVSGEEGLSDLTSVGLWNDKLGLQKDDFTETLKTVASGKLVGDA